jgi:hypothetical protein
MRVSTKTEIRSPVLQPAALKSAVEKLVERTAFDYERQVKEQMRQPKHGRVYRRGRITKAASPKLPAGLRTYQTAKGKRRAVVGYKIHRASAPGEAPATDSSILINSIKVKPEGTRAVITVGAPYGGVLEYKKDRAVFEPTLERMRPGFLRDVNQEVNRLCQ